MIDRVFGVFLLLLGVFVLYGGLMLQVPFSYDPLGPKAFPIILGVLLSVLSVVVIVKPQATKFPGLNTELKTVLIVVLLVMYQVTFNVLGFLLSTTFLVFFIAKIFKGTTLQAFSAGIGVSLCVYGIFSFLLDVPLPVGSIFARLLGVSA
jgi:putative tricarboxylic transport membrane protein